VNAVLDSLTLMLYLLVPWTALNLVDFFFVRHGHYAITDIFRPDGGLAVNPFSIDEAISAIERGARGLLERAGCLLTLGGRVARPGRPIAPP